MPEEKRKKKTVIGQIGDFWKDVAVAALDLDEDKEKAPEHQLLKGFKTKDKVFLKKFVVFKCGHSFHEKCIIAQRSKANY